jgi:deoxycytidylate deaminase
MKREDFVNLQKNRPKAWQDKINKSISATMKKKKLEKELNNHKVVSVIHLELDKPMPVYDMEVPKYHNFAIEVGDYSCIFVHNCRSVHSEVNAICQAAKFGIRFCGADLYCTHLPCITCAKVIIQSKIKNVYYKGEYPDIATTDLFKEANINLFIFP